MWYLVTVEGSRKGEEEDEEEEEEERIEKETFINDIRFILFVGSRWLHIAHDKIQVSPARVKFKRTRPFFMSYLRG